MHRYVSTAERCLDAAARPEKQAAAAKGLETVARQALSATTRLEGPPMQLLASDKISFAHSS
jgi:hypothetical protein